MCRFLIVKSKSDINPKPLLEKFSDMAEKSRAFDGDWQGDGWGYSWLDINNQWQLYHSLKPIWEDRYTADSFPATSFFSVHARSASFSNHKGVLEYNQPYVFETYTFVFNGLLKGVSLNIPGAIGAQKIWHLIRKELENHSPEDSLRSVRDLLLKNTKEIQALNMGICTKKNASILCYYSNHPLYYQLHHYEDDNMSFISSEDLTGYTAASISTNQFITI